MNSLSRIGLITVLAALLFSTSSGACVAYFGYTGVTVDEIDSIVSSVSVSTAYVTVQDESDYIVKDVEYIKVRSGPVVLNLQDIIFNPNETTGVDCRHYERGGLGSSNIFHQLRGSFRSRLDTFFDLNADLFQNDLNVIGLVIHSEANNSCVENWKLATAAAYVKEKLAKPGYYMPRLMVGYGLRNTPNGPVSKGFPVNPDGSIGKFPKGITTIGYYVYDIFDPNNPGRTANLNAESWTTISAKLDQALWSHQKTAGVLKAYCRSGGAEETHWGVGCPNLANWKLGVLARNWRDYWLSDPRNEFVLGFHWPNAAGFFGTENMSQIWGQHSAIDAARNCVMSFPVF